jgi:Uma2 family endonuclease
MTAFPGARCIMAHASRDRREIMQMATKIKRWARADLDRLPDDGNTYEVVHGELFVTPPPGAPHQWIAMRLTRLLVPYVLQKSIGDVHVPRTPVIFEDSQVEPDLMVLPPMQSPPAKWESMPMPLLVVEIASSTTARRDRIAKRVLYMEAGVGEYWIVDGRARTVTVVRRDQPDMTSSDSVIWHPEGAQSPLVISLQELFEA